MNVLRAFGGRKTRIDDKRRLIRLGRDEYKYLGWRPCRGFADRHAAGAPSRLIYSSTIRRWLPPHEQEEIFADKREAIAETIRLFLERQGETVAIQK